MDKIIITGGQPLTGTIKSSGAKNAVLPIMTACILVPGTYTLRNVPNLRDTRTMAGLLEIVGAKVEYSNGTLRIDTTHCDKPVAPYDLVKTMRASFYVLGPFMGRFKRAEVSLPGGCAWGPRPVDFHLKALERMGAKVTLKEGNIVAEGQLHGSEITFDKSSVGATGNVLMAAVMAEGTTVIKNAAIEPEITSLADFLIEMGSDIQGLGTDTLVIKGKQNLKGDIEFDIIPDRIEVGTYLIASALSGGVITVENANSDHLAIVLSKLTEAGAKISIDKHKIHLVAPDEIRSVNITTAPYPGFPTDLQAQWMALMLKSTGTAVIIDDIYPDRFTHIAELSRLGARIKLHKNVATVKGVDTLTGAPLMSTDIRASASLIIGALAAEGKSHISRIYHIDRGYENIEEKLRMLGGNIKRVSE